MIGKLKALVAGFVLGIFVAPRSGRASRQLLMERINEFFDMGERRLEALEGELETRRHARREPVGEWPETGESLAEHPLEDETIE
ncbi:MAG: YtxH domain-containing protein [Gemmatimonadetes bacterium]|nr:YtxH domain-containing protein [Gemmatimonadota bacterium]